MHIPAFDYPKAQGEPAMGKSIHKNGRCFIPITLLEKGKSIKLNSETTLETIQPIKAECVIGLQKQRKMLETNTRQKDKLKSP